MAAKAHWVGTIAFELRANEGAALDPVRAALRSDLQAVVLDPVEQALDRAEQAGRSCRRRRVEVDLGRFAADDLTGGRLARRIVEALGRQLGTDSAPVRSGDPRPVSAAGDEADQLAVFLATGLLAWPAPGKALAAICASLAGRDAAGMARAVERLCPLLASNAVAAERLVRQCPASLVRRIAAVLAAQTVADSSVQEIDATPIPGHRTARWTAAIIRLARLGRYGGGQADARTGAAAISADGVVRKGDIGRALLDETGRDDAPPPGHARAEPSAAETVAAETQDREGCPAADEAVPRALPIDAAGAVLLHPFLSGLFKGTGLIGEGDAFPDSAARARGVLLLHYAATGREEAAESELPLFKLLCGMDLSTIVPRRLDPTDCERAEAEALLAAMIAHWNALGDTSAAVLRETFLLRPGRLELGTGEWRLRVETRGVDVLLDRLPWSVSIVRTPFMVRLLRVDWR